MLNPNNKQIKKVFINSLEDMTKNNEIPEDIIIEAAKECNLEANKIKGNSITIVKKIISKGQYKKLFQTLYNYVCLPIDDIASYYGIDKDIIELLIKSDVMKYECDLTDRPVNKYPINILEYDSMYLLDIFEKLYINNNFVKVRVETETKEKAVEIVDEMAKILMVKSNYKIKPKRNNQGYYAYAEVEKAQDTEEFTNNLVLENNKLKDDIKVYQDKIKSLEAKIKGLEEKQKRFNNLGRKNKFTDKQIQKIKKLRVEGKTIRQIAAEYDCSIGLIHKLISKQ